MEGSQGPHRKQFQFLQLITAVSILVKSVHIHLEQHDQRCLPSFIRRNMTTLGKEAALLLHKRLNEIRVTHSIDCFLWMDSKLILDESFMHILMALKDHLNMILHFFLQGCQGQNGLKCHACIAQIEWLKVLAMWVYGMSDVSGA